MDMGDAVVLPGANGNLLAEAQLEKRYRRVNGAPEEIVYSHRISGFLLTFVKDRERFGNSY